MQLVPRGHDRQCGLRPARPGRRQGAKGHGAGARAPIAEGRARARAGGVGEGARGRGGGGEDVPLLSVAARGAGEAQGRERVRRPPSPPPADRPPVRSSPPERARARERAGEPLPAHTHRATRGARAAARSFRWCVQRANAAGLGRGRHVRAWKQGSVGRGVCTWGRGRADAIHLPVRARAGAPRRAVALQRPVGTVARAGFCCGRLRPDPCRALARAPIAACCDLTHQCVHLAALVIATGACSGRAALSVLIPPPIPQPTLTAARARAPHSGG